MTTEDYAAWLQKRTVTNLSTRPMTMKERVRDLKLIQEDLEQYHLYQKAPSQPMFRLLSQVIADMELAVQINIEKARKAHAARNAKEQTDATDDAAA
jgi:hypothetical protein